MRRQLDLAEIRAHLCADHPALVQQGMIEAGYFNVYGELPPNAEVFERIEWTSDGVLIVHQDHFAVRH